VWEALRAAISNNPENTADYKENIKDVISTQFNEIIEEAKRESASIYYCIYHIYSPMV